MWDISFFVVILFVVRTFFSKSFCSLFSSLMLLLPSCLFLLNKLWTWGEEMMKDDSRKRSLESQRISVGNYTAKCVGDINFTCNWLAVKETLILTNWCLPYLISRIPNVLPLHSADHLSTVLLKEEYWVGVHEESWNSLWVLWFLICNWKRRAECLWDLHSFFSSCLLNIVITL